MIIIAYINVFVLFQVSVPIVKSVLHINVSAFKILVVVFYASIIASLTPRSRHIGSYYEESIKDFKNGLMVLSVK